MEFKHVLYLIAAIVFAACSSEDIPQDQLKQYTAIDSPDVSQAKPYYVINTFDKSFAGRKRMEYVILAPEASTFDQFAHTAIKAAIDIEREIKSDVIYIRLEPTTNLQGTGVAYALAFYAPDGKGHSGYAGDQKWTWYVVAMQEPMSTQQIKIDELWWEYRDYFQKDGYTDEPALREFISNELNIPKDEVHLQCAIRNKYGIKER